MRIAMTGGTGFVGGHLAHRLAADGHDVVVLSRRTGTGLDAGPEALARAIAGCEAVVHCAGINREIGDQTYDAVHVQGTQALVEATRAAGVERLVMLSFLRARPDGPSAYHRSKWAAEEAVRGSGLPSTILKAGVIHGRGDHMLDHLSRAFRTFPVFGLVGRSRSGPLVRPVAVDDVVAILAAAALGDPRLEDRTTAVMGPETMTLEDAVRRVAVVVRRTPHFIRLPVLAHLAIARLAEAVMRVPLVSLAQVHILAEGIVEPLPSAGPPPDDLAPRTPFDAAVITRGLPDAGGFGRADLRWCRFGRSEAAA